jgi:hypothetical protein
MVKRKRTKGGADTMTSAPVLTKQEVLQDPKIKQALQTWAVQQGGGAKFRQIGGGWWDDFVGWLKSNKVISTASKIGSAIAGAVGFVPLSTALAGVSTTAGAFGYGRMKGGMFYSSEDAQAIARGIVGRPAMRISRPRMIGGNVNMATPVAYNNTASSLANLKF